MSVKGRVVWHDLMTNDVEAARAFYPALFGWDIRTAEGFTLIETGEGHIGGVNPLPPGVPAHFLPYIGSDDVHATAAAIPAAGGRIVVPAMDIPGGGRFVIATDPQGAAFAAFQYTGERGPKPELSGNEPPPVGSFCWDELHTADTASAAAFYTGLFGWGTQQMDMGPGGIYTIFRRGERQAGGMNPLAPGMPASFWLPYMWVADADAAAARTGELGGRSLFGPENIPDIGRFAVLMDNQGVVFGILGPGA